MPYRLVSYDVLDGPKAITLSPDEDGIAVTIRRRGEPVGFVLRALGRRERGTPVSLHELIDRDTAGRIAASAAREELPGRADATALSVSIAICTHDRTELLHRCLQSLFDVLASSPHRPGSVEVIVIDNAPGNDRTRELLARSFPKARYILEPTPGLDFARNRALEEARGELVAYLDDDVVVEPGWLGGLVDAWAADPAAGFITGLVLPLELETEAQVAFERRGGFRRGFDRVHYAATRVGDPCYPCEPGIFGTGANTVVNRRAALELGGFDEALDAGAILPGGGDLDMYYRMIRAGYRAIYEPRMSVLHQHRRDFEGLERQYRESWGKAYMAFVAKSWRQDPPMRPRWLLALGRWFAMQAAHLITRARGPKARPASLILQETLGGLQGLAGEYDRAQRRVEELRRRSST
jgi:GT2 family glycosyltransferase